MKTEMTINDLGKKLDRLEAITAIGVKNVLTINEAALLTGFSREHIYRLTGSRKIPHFKNGRKVYFRKDELEEWMTDIRVKTQAELEAEAQRRTCRNHLKSKISTFYSK